MNQQQAELWLAAMADTCEHDAMESKVCMLQDGNVISTAFCGRCGFPIYAWHRGEFRMRDDKWRLMTEVGPGHFTAPYPPQ